MKVIIEIPEELIEIAQKQLIIGTDMPTLANAISNGIIISDNSTNGDIIMAMFPQAKIIINELLGTNGTVFVQYGSEEYDEIISYSLDWWNAPYNGEEE